MLAEHVTNTHCSEIDEYALVLRVDGSLDRFGVEGLARLRFAKSQRYITVDIQVPEEVWKPLDEFQTKYYLAKQVKAAIDACVGRLVKDRCPVNVDALQSEVDAALRNFVGVEE